MVGGGAFEKSALGGRLDTREAKRHSTTSGEILRRRNWEGAALGITTIPTAAMRTRTEMGVRYELGDCLEKDELLGGQYFSNPFPYVYVHTTLSERKTKQQASSHTLCNSYTGSNSEVSLLSPVLF